MKKKDKIMTQSEQNKNPVGRPKLKVDHEILANLAQIGCTQEEIAAVVGISARTLQRNFADLIQENKNKGRASLRKKMWDKALKLDNTHMQIWLSKNELGMKDRAITETVTEPLPLIIEGEVEEVGEKKR
ncbi:MAG: hypothetical protein VW810_00495 [Pelagibacteraceae bacterium]